MNKHQGKQKLKTARCVLWCDDAIFLAVDSSFWARPNRRWGLPGGGIEWRESPERAVSSELGEELDIYVPEHDLIELGVFHYKRGDHIVYGAEVPTQIQEYDDSELLDIGWFNFNEINDLESSGKLHAGYEREAIERYLKFLKKI